MPLCSHEMLLQVAEGLQTLVCQNNMREKLLEAEKLWDIVFWPVSGPQRKATLNR
jgi:intracellular sulfur oxidation DsrE/DsrF family protein